MKKSRFTESQILAVLRQAEVGCLVLDLCREHGISTATFYKCALPPIPVSPEARVFGLFGLWWAGCATGSM